jgi:hypothetical protein
MEDTNRIRLIMIGIILVVVAAGYLLFSQANRAFKSRTAGVSPSPVAILTVPSPTPVGLRVITPTSTPRPTSSSQPAVVGVSKGGVQKNLPATGFPAGLAGVFAVSAAIIGYSLRKYPQ